MIISDCSQNTSEKHYREFAKTLYNGGSGHIDGHFFIESILFEPSDSSNLLQLVDIASYAFQRKYNASDSSLYNILKPRIMRRGNILKGAGVKLWP